jgi:hypothetical protein
MDNREQLDGRLYRPVTVYDMQNKGALTEYDPVHNIVYYDYTELMRLDKIEANAALTMREVKHLRGVA